MAPLSSEQFAKILTPFQLEWPIAVAVSGGADSMALVRLMHRFALENGLTDQLIALTVDHQLRPESTREAEQVGKWISALGVRHRILLWQHPPLSTRIEAKGREARYALLGGYCATNDIPTLLTAHQAADQVETFWMRLARGSSLTGLCAIRPSTQISPRLRLVRPLLTIMPEVLRCALSEDFHQPFLHDPSNDAACFERVRWRQRAPALRELGLDAPAILRTVARLQAVEEALELEALQFAQQHIRQQDQGLRLPLAALAELNAACAQIVLRHAAGQVAPSLRPPSHPLLSALYARIIAHSFRATTGLHCLWRRAQGSTLEITREQRAEQ